MSQEQEMDNSEDEDEGRPLSTAELAGMKVRHTADELQEGQGMILTLADRGILDEKGMLIDDADELEEVVAVRSHPCCRRKPSDSH
jgi:U4/U6.U5 tri-snRNP-associated protein 1